MRAPNTVEEEPAAQVLETLRPRSMIRSDTILLLRACVTFIAVHRDHLHGVTERRFAQPHGHSLLGQRECNRISAGWWYCVSGLRRGRNLAANRPRTSGDPRFERQRDGPGLLAQIGRGLDGQTIVKAMTERRRPDRSKEHEVEQPGHRRLDMPEEERLRQGPGEAWPPPFVRDCFEMKSTR